ncbi:MAG TPA: hypothetical protein VFM42_00285 [Sphingomicrobium sp.]|nr:hypothetical protein [Sphingomicrobium sp.]
MIRLHLGILLIHRGGGARYLPEKMNKTEPPIDDEAVASDLAHRLDRYRRRVAAEGRPRSARLIDRAIEKAARKAIEKE